MYIILNSSFQFNNITSIQFTSFSIFHTNVLHIVIQSVYYVKHYIFLTAYPVYSCVRVRACVCAVFGHLSLLALPHNNILYLCLPGESQNGDGRMIFHLFDEQYRTWVNTRRTYYILCTLCTWSYNPTSLSVVHKTRK